MLLKRLIKISSSILATAALLIGCSYLLLQSELLSNYLLHKIVATLNEHQWKVSIEENKGSLLSHIELRNVRIITPQGDTLSIGEWRFQVDLLALLKREVSIQQSRMTQVHWTSPNKFSFPSQTSPSEATPIALPIPETLPFMLTLPHFICSDVSSSLIEDFSVDMRGSLKIPRKQEDISLKVSIQERSPCPVKAVVRFSGRDLFHLKIDAKIPSLSRWSSLPIAGSAKIHVHAHGSHESLLHLGRKHTSPHPIYIKLKSDADIVGCEETFFAHPFLTGKWSLQSALLVDDHGNWHVTRFFLSSPLIESVGRFKWDPEWNLRLSRLRMETKCLPHWPCSGSFIVDLKGKNQNFSINISTPSIESRWWNLQAVQAHMQLTYDSICKGTSTFQWHFHERPWEGNAQFSIQDHTLRLDSIQLGTQGATFSGNLYLNTQGWEGNLQAQVADAKILLGNDVRGKIDLQLQGFLNNANQSFDFHVKGSDLMWHDATNEKLLVYAYYSGNEGHLSFVSENFRWKELFLSQVSIDNTLGVGNHPFHALVRGNWRGPLEGIINGSWHYTQDLRILINKLQGNLQERKLTLTGPANFSFGNQQNGELSLTLNDASFSAKWNACRDMGTGYLKLANFPLRFFTPSDLSPFTAGIVNAEADLQVSKSTEGTLQLSIQDIEISDSRDSVQGDWALSSSLANENLKITTALAFDHTPFLEAKANLPLKIHTNPWRWEIPPLQDLSVIASLDGRIENLLDFFNLGIHRVEGVIQANLEVSNNFEHPRVEGKINLHNGHYENYYTGLQLQQLEVRGKAHHKHISLDSITARDRVGLGKLWGSGNLRLHSLSDTPFHFDASFSNFQIADISSVRALGDGKISITGNQEEAEVRGETKIIQADLFIPEQIPYPIPILPVKYLHLPPTPRSRHSHPYLVTLNYRMIAPEKIYILGRGLTSEWQGQLTVTGHPHSLEARGQLELIGGDFAFSGREFNLTKGVVLFTGKPEAAPILDVAAKMQMQNLSIIARLEGPLDSPRLFFHSVPPLPMGSLLSQMLFGQDIEEINAVQATEVLQSLTMISEESPSIFENTRRALGIDRLRVIATPLGDAGGETVSLQVGKYVTRGVLLSITQGIGEGSTNLGIEVDIGKGFLFQAQSEREQEQGKFGLNWRLNY